MEEIWRISGLFVGKRQYVPQPAIQETCFISGPLSNFDTDELQVRQKRGVGAGIYASLLRLFPFEEVMTVERTLDKAHYQKAYQRGNPDIMKKMQLRF